MPLREHLVEIRKRLFLAAIGIVLGAVVGWIVYEPVLQALQQPLVDAAERRDVLTGLNFEGVATAIDMKVKVSCSSASCCRARGGCTSSSRSSRPA